MPIDSPLDGLAGIESPFGSDGGSAPLIITATVAPSIGALADGDQVQDGLAASATDTANYASTAGTISSAVATVTIDGSPGTLTDVVSYNEEVSVSITVTDSAANERVFSAGGQTVAGIAPTVTASDGLLGRTLTIEVDSTTGTPSPMTALTVLTLDGADVLGDETGAGPWDYVVPDDDASQTVAWTVTATNVAGSDTDSGSVVVSANLFAPTAAGGITDKTYTEDAAITPLNVASDFTGTAPITYALAPSSAALPAGLSLSGAGTISGTPTTVASLVNIVVRGTNAYGSDDTAFGVTIDPAVETDPPVIVSDSYDDGTKEITLDVEDETPPITVVWATVANPDTPTKADILNGTGTTIENGSFSIGTGSESNTINVTDETADEIHYYLIDDLGNETTIQIITGVTITDPLLLDDYPGAVGAWSLRKLSSSTTNVARLRNSDSQAEQDFTADEITDGTLASFAAGGDDVAVVTMYDQSGNGNDLTQSVAGDQPFVVEGGTINFLNGRAAVRYNGIQHFLEMSGQLITTNTWHMFCHFSKTSGAISGRTILSQHIDATTGRALFLRDAGDTISISINNGTSFSPTSSLSIAAAGAAQVGESRALSDDYDVAKDGGAFETVISGETFTPLNTPFVVGALDRGNNGYWSGRIGDVIVYDSDQTSNRTAIVSDIENA